MKELISDLVKNLEPRVETFHGLPYEISSQRGPTPILPRLPECLYVFSLAPMVSYLNRFPASEKVPGIIVNVEDQFTVTAQSTLSDEAGQREIIVKADFENSVERFQSNTRYSQEDFITRLQSLFKVNYDREELMKLVGSVRSDAENVTSDDGVTQNVQVKAGVHLSKEVKVRNPWELLPYKTFPEIEPVEVPYVLRVSKGGRDGTEFALYESDGGRWKIKTTQAIREYLKANLKADHVTVL